MNALFNPKQGGGATSQSDQDFSEVIIKLLIGLALALGIGFVGGFKFIDKRKFQNRADLSIDPEIRGALFMMASVSSMVLILNEGGKIKVDLGSFVIYSSLIISGLSLGAICLQPLLDHVQKGAFFKSFRFAGFVANFLMVCGFGIVYYYTIEKITSNAWALYIVTYLLTILFGFGSVLTFRRPITKFFVRYPMRIVPDLLHVKVRTGGDSAYTSPNNAPMGVSLSNGKVKNLATFRRTEHVMVAGATGGGKTTLMTMWIAHAILYGFPAIVIDQKGDGSLVNLLKQYCLKHNIDQNRIVRFSMSDQMNSVSYNPLNNGTAIEIKDRIMGAFDWSDDYYKSMAARALSVIVPALIAINEVPTLAKLKHLIRDCEARRNLKEIIKGAYSGNNKESNVVSKEYLDECLSNLISFDKLKTEDFEGLLAQLEVLSNIENGKFLSPDINAIQIRFEDVVAKKQIVVFELPAASGDQSKRVGRILLSHLKSFMQLIESKRVEMPEFLPVFIDEFGEFATDEFITFLKQARSAKIGVHMFFQSLGDLKRVGDHFVTQVVDSTVTKVIFRQDDPSSCDYWSQVAGTVRTVERSHQVGRGSYGFVERTGMGNERETMEMLIAHDVFKGLNKFQAVVIEKGPLAVDVVEVWPVL